MLTVTPQVHRSSALSRCFVLPRPCMLRSTPQFGVLLSVRPQQRTIDAVIKSNSGANSPIPYSHLCALARPRWKRQDAYFHYSVVRTQYSLLADISKPEQEGQIYRRTHSRIIDLGNSCRHSSLYVDILTLKSGRWLLRAA